MTGNATYRAPRGLYDPTYEHDACGVAFVARLRAPASHEVVERALVALDHMEHRGAEGADPETGDGAGILFQIPDRFMREELAGAGIDLPAFGEYGIGVCFLPAELEARERTAATIEEIVAAEGQQVLGWREVPVDTAHCGTVALRCAPHVAQLVVGAGDGVDDHDALERRLYLIRRRIEQKRMADLAIPSFSSRTIVYKGMLKAPQLPGYFPDLRDPRVETRLALVHSRFSTNTFPSWALAHPYRMLAHNGEINTLRGNRNWMRAREDQLSSSLFADTDFSELAPLLHEDLSDSASLDAVFELLVLGGRSPAHAISMLIPEAYEGRGELPPAVKDFFAYHGSLMEPWDGPAAVAFTDGRVIGATLDRNGLRPGRWLETDDGWVVFASETGVLEFPPENVVARGRLHPGKLFFVDLENERIAGDDELKEQLAARRPYKEWMADRVVGLEDLPERSPRVPRVEPLRARQLAFGWSEEDLRVLLAPMARTGAEPTGSMGNDTALAVLSDNRPPLFNYFKQLFAQVTNPAIDPIRETVVTSLISRIGPELNLLGETADHCHQLVMGQPIIRNADLERVRQVDHYVFESRTIDMTWPVAEGARGMERRLDEICAEASRLVEGGMTILILSDRNIGAERAPIPSLLATAAVHHHLVRERTRLNCGLVVETGEAREVHHIACLIGYGASAVNPYLMFEALSGLHRDGRLNGDLGIEAAQASVIKAIGKGLLKILSKMGISTIRSYSGAQIFEAIGLDQELVDRHFTGTKSRIGGIGLDVLAAESLDRHARAYPNAESDLLPSGGVYAWRRDGEFHGWNPETIANLQHAARSEGPDAYDRFRTYVNDVAVKRSTLRGLLQFSDDVEPIPLAEVEDAKDIVKRFKSGGMSLGALSPEAHEGLAVAMNRLGGKSNTGEGGEDPARFHDERRSSIKQVASGRFGVTIEYLVNADELQIKVAQGAKPGEGGQLPGHKVDDYIARLRHSTPGVGLISPPPHHDIYSIEDLKQLIYDLRCGNPRARVSVKLVSEIGVGTVAAGVAKANADHVVIAGHDGGTGASPQSSIHHAGIPWEIGLAETQQTLLRNDLRSRIIVETDGQLRTGRDVVIAALLGADEYGFSTAPLIALGCVMMRVCHLNTCPVGIATQDPVLRERFQGQPEHVVNYLFMVAEEARELMAGLGVRTIDELIGRTELLRTDDAVDHWKARGIDLSPLLSVPEEIEPDAPRHRTRGPEPVLDDAIDHGLIDACRAAIDSGEKVQLQTRIENKNRTVGGLLSSEIARLRGADGLAEGTIEIGLEGSAGQSFGAWLAPGVTLTLTGDANDYVGKGLSGGTVVVHPHPDAAFAAEDNVVVGNTVLYGATSGKAFFRGFAGERFAVRNSGVSTVVEGVGDHGCEYMTGGRVVVIGPTGLNFAAGMSGGIAYVHDPDGAFPARCNMELVGIEELGGDDAEEVRALIAEHGERTGSPVAERLLGDWEATRAAFVKVMPHDYKRALEEAAAASNKTAAPA